MTQSRTGDLFALSCAVACGLGNIPSKLALLQIPVGVFNFYMFLSAFLFSSFPLIRKKERMEIVGVKPKILLLTFVLALLFTAAMTLNMKALQMIDPATASFLSRFEAVLTVALAYMILRERLTLFEIVGGMVALAGVFVLRFKTNMAVSRGASFMVMATLFFAVAEVIIKKNIAQIGTASFLFYRNLMLVPMFYLALIVQKETLFLPSPEILSLALAAGFLLPVLGRATYQMALKRINISRAALITQTTPLFTAFFAFMILRTSPTIIEWLGGGLIIGGVVVVKISEARLIARKT